MVTWVKISCCSNSLKNGSGSIEVSGGNTPGATRPSASQIAAIVSRQSSKIKSRNDLQNLFDEKKIASDSIKRPENWGGYIVKPKKYEFWQGRESRLHDRILFELDGDNWIISRLAP